MQPNKKNTTMWKPEYINQYRTNHLLPNTFPNVGIIAECKHVQNIQSEASFEAIF